MNPMIAVCAFLAVLYLLYSLAILAFGLPRINVTLSAGEKDRIRLLVILLVLTNWLYLISTL